MCKIGKEKSVKECRSSSNSASINWIAKRFRSNQGLPNQEVNPCSLSHKNHPPLHTNLEHHPAPQNHPSLSEYGESISSKDQFKGLKSVDNNNNNNKGCDNKECKIDHSKDEKLQKFDKPEQPVHHNTKSSDAGVPLYSVRNDRARSGRCRIGFCTDSGSGCRNDHCHNGCRHSGHCHSRRDRNPGPGPVGARSRPSPRP